MDPTKNVLSSKFDEKINYNKNSYYFENKTTKIMMIKTKRAAQSTHQFSCSTLISSFSSSSLLLLLEIYKKKLFPKNNVIHNNFSSFCFFNSIFSLIYLLLLLPLLFSFYYYYYCFVFYFYFNSSIFLLLLLLLILLLLLSSSSSLLLLLLFKKNLSKNNSLANLPKDGATVYVAKSSSSSSQPSAAAAGTRIVLLWMCLLLLLCLLKVAAAADGSTGVQNNFLNTLNQVHHRQQQQRSAKFRYDRLSSSSSITTQNTGGRLFAVPSGVGKTRSVSPSGSLVSSSSSSSATASSALPSVVVTPGVDPGSIQQHWHHQQCPSPDELIAPCVCNATKKEVFCRGSPLDSGKKLRQSFQLFAKHVPPSLQYYHSVYINLRGLVSLERAIFSGIRFNTIFLRGNNLTNIERDAFQGTEHFVQSLYIYGTNLTSKADSRFNFFDAVKQLSHLQKLIINQNNLTEIPDRAFTFPVNLNNNNNKNNNESVEQSSASTVATSGTPHSSGGAAAGGGSNYPNHHHRGGTFVGLPELTEIQISNGMIETIGSDAFGDLKNLANLGLTKNRIQTIKAHAFRMRHQSNMTLFIDLTENPLTSESFESGALIGSKRPLKIHLGLNGCTVSLQNLPEKIFRPFLDENQRNIIDVGRHCYHIKCDCQMAWTLAERYTYRVKNFRCLTNNGSVYFRDFLDKSKCLDTSGSTSVSDSTTQGPTSVEQPKPVESGEEINKSKDQSSNEIDRSGGQLPTESTTGTETTKVSTPGEEDDNTKKTSKISVTNAKLKPSSSSERTVDQLADVEYCQSKKCTKQGIEMNNYLNRSVDPCESFYDFACNGWENNHLLEYLVQVLSNGGSEYDNFVKVRLRVEENLEKLLSAENNNGNGNGNGGGSRGDQTKSSLKTSSVASSLNTYRNFTTVMVNSGDDSTNNHHQNGRHLVPINPVRNVKEMYVQCTTLPKGANFEALGTVLGDIGGWPLLTKKFNSANYRWEKYFPVVVNQYKENIFIEIDASVNENSTKHLMIKAGSFIVSKRKLLSVKLNRLENYATYMLNTAMHFGAQNNQNETLNEVWDVIRFEKQIANIAKKNLGNDHMIERKLETIGCLIQEIDWLRILFEIHGYHRDHHQGPNGEDGATTDGQPVQFTDSSSPRLEAALVSSTEQFAQSKAMYDVHFLIDLSRLLARTDRKIIANYIGWRVIESVGHMIGGSAFVEIQQNFYSTESKEGTKLIRKQCLEPLVRSVPYLMARIFLERHLPEQARNNARQIIEAVKGSFVQSMGSKGWIDESKEGLMQKIENIQVNIGYPDWILNNDNLLMYYRILNYTRGEKPAKQDDDNRSGSGGRDRVSGTLQSSTTPSSINTNAINTTTTIPTSSSSELIRFYNRIQQIGMQHMLTGIGEKINKSHYWDPLPLYVGASYDIVDNIIAIPMGLLQPPFYEDDRPFYLNFASLGSFFGHELSHSVTPRYTEFEKLLPPWTDHFLKVYLTKAQCFVSQYTSYYDKTAEQHLDGMRTFEEDMSDLAGIHAAFDAYQRRTSNEIIQKLQELPEFSTDMLFFLSFAQKWCRSNSRVQTRLKISKSVHSPEKYRVNGALSNLEAFALAFNCTAGTAMNPIKKCESW